MTNSFDYVNLISSEIKKAFADKGLSPQQLESLVLEKVNTLIEEQDFISEILADLYRIQNWDKAIKTVLGKTGEYLDVSRIFIMERVGNTQNLILEYLWHKSDYPSQSGITLPDSISAHLFDYLKNNDYYSINSTDNTTAEYARYLQSLNINSCLIFPIKMHERIFGFIGLDECSRTRNWDEDEIRMISMLSELVSHAILQKITQKELSRSNEILNQVLDSIHAIITVIDVETNRILYLNKFATNVFGDVVGEICWKQLHGDLSSPCENCPRPGQGEYKDEEVVIKEIQNTYWKRWYHTTNTIIEWKEGQRAHLEIAIDITDRVETETQMRFTTKRLEELNQTKDKFFSIVAHDLKNPMYSLMGFAEIIRNTNQQLSPEEITEYSDLIYQSARNTHQLLQNLMVWSQSQTGKLRYNPIPVSMNQLLDNAIEFTKPVALQKDITINKDYAINQSLNIDPNMITAAIRNLLTNAVKFSHLKSEIIVRLYSTDSQYCVAIQDYGIGISEEDLQKLFRIDVDHRSIGTVHTDAKGTGLGLILVKEFITMHQGSIDVQSEVGKGSTFTICLPSSLAPVESDIQA